MYQHLRLSVRLSLHFTNVWFPFLSFSRKPLLISSLTSGFLCIYILRSDGVRKIFTSPELILTNLRTWIWRLVDKLIVAQLVKKVSPRVTELWEVPFPYLFLVFWGGGVITTHTRWGSVGVTQWLPVSQCGCHSYGRARFVSDVTMHWRQTGRIGRSVITVFTVRTRCCYLE